ncbi:protein PML-like [Strongylocentrotus purpuratus]|uniref:Uncharacterized protein n=1 Tax=Strongylocentrotus purpuratus TaxID=7668 RepID=A0A7M7NJQ0_STRPU|nr:protein PML-like [Strongylocentrotus purpuratus]
MASSNTNLLDSVVSEEVECAICLNKLDTPRILTCLHSFCEKCLEKCVQNRKDDSSQSGNSTLKCALCNEYTALNDAGVRGLRLDFRATRLVEALQEKETQQLKLASSAHRCETCGCTDSGETASKEKPPFTYCRECCQVLCQRCSAVHAGLRMTRTHTVANISDLLNGKVTIQTKDHSMLCPKHADEKLKIFCVTCLEPVCHDCTLIDHNREQGHQLQFLKDFVPIIREELSSRQEEVSEKSEEFSEFLHLVDELENHAMDKTKKTSKSIQNAIVEYISRVEQVRLPMEKVACDYLGEKIKQLNQLRKKTQHIKSLAEKSLLLTQQMMENEQDLIGLASMYKSLREAMDRAIAEKPDEQELEHIRESIDHLHYHVTHLDAKVGNVAVGCRCTERSTSSVACNNGPKDVQFTRDGRISAIVQVECIGEGQGTVYVKYGTETLYTYGGYFNNVQRYKQKAVTNLTMFAAIKQTSTSFPNCTSFSWTRWLPTLQYGRIGCFTSLSDHRFIIATTDAKLYILGDTLGEFSHGLPDTRSISALATDNEDNIYITDRDNHKIYILRSDGNLKDTLNVGDISPTCIAVPHLGPDVIAVTHEPATVSILDLNGNTLCSIHNEEWKKVAIGCDADRLLYILWSDQNHEKTLQRYTFQGVQVDTLFEKESHSYNDLVLAVSPTGASAAAVVTTTGADGKVVTMAPGEKPSPKTLP